MLVCVLRDSSCVGETVRHWAAAGTAGSGFIRQQVARQPGQTETHLSNISNWMGMQRKLVFRLIEFEIFIYIV